MRVLDDKANARLVTAVKELNNEIFKPKGLVISINCHGDSLDIALSAEEARFLRIEGTIA